MTAVASLTEQRALQLLEGGYTPRQIVSETGVSIERLRVLTAARRQQAAALRGGARELPVDVLDPHESNVRADVGDVAELAASVRALGILQPLLVTPGSRAGRYTVIAGHRRLAAAKLAALPNIPVTIRAGLTSTDELEVMLAENLQRVDLNPIEEAQAYQALLKMGRTKADVAAAVGRSTFHIGRRVDLLALTAEEQRLVITGELTLEKAGQVARLRIGNRPKGGRGISRPKPFRVPYFTKAHPLADTAHARCEQAGHGITTRLGPACGACWERTIRDDDATGVGA